MLPVTRSDAHWQKILPFLLAHPKLYVGPQWSRRRFLSAVLWVSRSGAQWPTAAERVLRHSPRRYYCAQLEFGLSRLPDSNRQASINDLAVTSEIRSYRSFPSHIFRNCRQD
jgi:hypothetical protein